jgi:DNA polymerase-3 subunit delta
MGVHVVRGDDPILRSNALDALVRQLVGDEDRSLAVEDLTVPGRATDGEAGGAEARQAVVAAAVNAAQSPPFMTTTRVVVLREVQNLLAGDVGPLVAYLTDPLDTTELVLVTGGGRMPDALTKAIKDAAAIEHGAARTNVDEVLAASLEDAGISLRPDALRAITERVGGEAGRVPAIVDVLAAAFGRGQRLSAADVAPYLGEAGSVPAWELTRAIENGDVASAIAVVQRLMTATGPQQPKPMHPLQILAMLHHHYRRIARLDDDTIRTKADAVAALGGRVRDFQAERALRQARALGADGIREAYAALAQADLDLKGARAIPEAAVLEVLVARLAALTGRSGVGQKSRGRDWSGAATRRPVSRRPSPGGA